MLSLALGGLKILGKTKLGKKVTGKALGIAGKALKKIGIGKKSRAGSETGSLSDLVDPLTMSGMNNIVEGENDDPKKKGVGGRIIDAIKGVKDGVGPIETDNKVTFSPTVIMTIAGLAVAGIVIALIAKK